MRTAITLLMFGLLAGGCGFNTGRPKEEVLAVRFPADLIDHKAEEAIHQVEIIARPAAIHKIGKLPRDWHASISEAGKHGAGCALGCDHDWFSVSDVRELNDVIQLRVQDGARQNLRVSARVWITRGPLGPGRIVDVVCSQFTVISQEQEDSRPKKSAGEKAQQPSGADRPGRGSAQP